MPTPTTSGLLLLITIIGTGASYAQESRTEADAPQWPVHITHHPNHVRTDNRSMLDNAILNLACTKDQEARLGASLYGYTGNGLERIPNIDRPASFLIMTAQGTTHRFPLVIHYDGEAWDLGNDLPPTFLEMLASGSALVLENANFDQVLVFDLRGSESFREAAARECDISISGSHVSTLQPNDVTVAQKREPQAEGSLSVRSP